MDNEATFKQLKKFGDTTVLYPVRDYSLKAFWE